MTRIKFALLILSSCAVAAVAGDLFCRPNPLRRRCDIPAFHYQADAENVSRRAFGTTGPIVNASAAEGAIDGQKIFPFNSEDFIIDHCAVQKLTLTVNSNGSWIINGVAKQDVTTLNPIDRPQFEVFKRNRFHLILNGLRADRRSENPAENETGTTQLFRIAPEAFWVEKGQVKSFRIAGPKGNEPDLKSIYPLLQGAEAEFYYE